MGFVFKTIRKQVGEVSEEVCYHFEVFEDFMSFEKKDKHGTGPKNEITKGKYYRIDNVILGHGLMNGDIVLALEDSNDHGTALCKAVTGRWYVHVSEVELVD